MLKIECPLKTKYFLFAHSIYSPNLVNIFFNSPYLSNKLIYFSKANIYYLFSLTFGNSFKLLIIRGITPRKLQQSKTIVETNPAYPSIVAKCLELITLGDSITIYSSCNFSWIVKLFIRFSRLFKSSSF